VASVVVSNYQEEVDVEKFIRTVLGDLSGYAFISRASGKTANGKLNVNIHKTFLYPQQIDEMVKYAEEYAGEDVYLSPLLYGDKRNDKGNIARTPENALSSRTVYMDSDLCTPDKFRLPPSIHVVTSSGRGHDYWLLNDPVDAKRAAEVAHKITTAHKEEGCDPSGWSANKVLRLPDTVNTSHGFPESVVAEYSGVIYDINDIEGAYDDVQALERPILGRETSIQVATPKALPDYNDALAKLPKDALELALAEPKVGPDGNRSQSRYRLLCELFRLEDTITQEEILSIAWNAPASRKWSQEDPRGINGLIAEANKAYSEIQWELGQSQEPPELDTTEGNIDLLEGDEREVLKHHRTWVDQYVDWSQRKLAKQNPPYDRINAWTVLSCAFSDMAFIPRKSGPEGLNLYTMTLGETTTGKSQALKLMRTVLDEVFAEDLGYNLGGNASPNALGEKLIERDGKVSLFNKDEAHGLFKQWATQDWTSGMMEDLALLYDGVVPPMLRVGKKEMAKPAKTQFVMHLMGTPEEIAKSLNREMFKSGFLARFMWTIGEPRTLTKDAVVEEDSDGTEIRLGFEPMARQWAAEFSEIKRQLRSEVSSGKVSVGITKQAADRMTQAKWKLVNLVKKSDPNWDIINPSLVRMGVTIRKCATLLAVSDGRKETELIDVLKAIEAAEEWIKNLMIVARKINASDFERACDEVEAFVRSKDDKVKLEFVNRRFKAWRVRDLQEAIGALASQGRIKEVSESGGKWLAINKKE
jgi:hypothetical protein